MTYISASIPICACFESSALKDTSPSGTRYLATLALSAVLLYSIHKYLIRGGAEAIGGGCLARSHR